MTGSIEQRVRDEWEKQSADMRVERRSFEMVDAGHRFGFGVAVDSDLRVGVSIPKKNLGADPTDEKIARMVAAAIRELKYLIERKRGRG